MIEEKGLTDIPVAVMHNIVEQVLDKYDPRIATSYRNYRNYNLDSYDKVLITDDMSCPIDENTVLFVDSKPGYRQGKPAFDYTVKRVAKSLNTISYAVSKVKVS